MTWRYHQYKHVICIKKLLWSFKGNPVHIHKSLKGLENRNSIEVIKEKFHNKLQPSKTMICINNNTYNSKISNEHLFESHYTFLSPYTDEYSESLMVADNLIDDVRRSKWQHLSSHHWDDASCRSTRIYTSVFTNGIKSILGQTSS